MPVVTLNLSQNTANTILQQHATAENDTLADDVQLFFGAALAFSTMHGANNTPSHNSNGDLVLNYADGATNTITGLVLAADDKASATGFTDSAPGLFNLHMGGAFSYRYGLMGGALSLLNSDATITEGSFRTAYASSDPNYDPKLGNGSLSFSGEIHSSALGAFSGVIRSFTASSDHFLTSLDASGNFNISGNGLKVGLLQETPAVGGTLNAFHAHYEDGSSISVDNAAFAVSAASSIDAAFVLDGGNFSGNDVFNVTMPVTMNAPWKVSAGNGNDVIRLLVDGSVNADGGAGADRVVLSGTQASYSITNNGGGSFTVKAANGAVDTLTGIERLQFSDGAVAYDVDGVAGQLYRLYQAAFHRAPDAAGFGAWIKAMEMGVSLHDVAAGFTQSDEFHAIFGQTPNNAEIVSHLYENALHRSGETAGLQHWQNLLDTKVISAADALIGFSQSAECQSNYAAIIGKGISYTPFG